MTEHRQKILSCGKEVLGNPNYNQDKLEELLTAIISKTSKAGTIFRIDARGYTESGNEGKSTIITATLDMANSRIIVRIRLSGNSESWVADIYFKRTTQRNIPAFFSEVKKAAKSVCEKENERYLSPDNIQSAPAPVLAVQVGSQDLPADGETTALPPKKQRRKKTITSSVITDRMMLEILKGWEKNYASIRKIGQPEFWGIISPLGIGANRLMVLKFLEKRGIVSVSLPVKRKPVVELTQLGIDMLAEYKQQLEVEKLEAEKTAQLEKALTFPEKSLSSLKKLNSLQLLYLHLNEKELAEKEAVQKIAELQASIVKEEKHLTEIRASQKKDVKEIKRLISLINPDNLTELIEIATRSAGQKDVKK